MIKYLGSKRRLVPVLGSLVEAAGARSVLDLFTGTTRVAQEAKRRGAAVTAVDSARYAEAFARCYIETDLSAVDLAEVDGALAALAAEPDVDGYVTETFCRRSRFFQPANGRRIDAIREAIARDWAGHPLEPVLLTSLIEAADRVDSTTGVQMAYLKQWSPRSHQPLELRRPELLGGGGRGVRADALVVVDQLGSFDLAYLDPPYNQHRYFTNYHIWETLVAWDAPEHYGVACKRVDARDPTTASAFNRKRTMPAALADLVARTDAEVIVLSYNDEGWIDSDGLVELCRVHGDVVVLAFESNRYVGARIGIHDPAGRRVGTPGRLRNTEYLVVAGSPSTLRRLAGHPAWPGGAALDATCLKAGTGRPGAG